MRKAPATGLKYDLSFVRLQKKLTGTPYFKMCSNFLVLITIDLFQLIPSPFQFMPVAGICYFIMTMS